jgi:acyl-CoA synthetase (AMP-forming)/AMP-acid ligase II
MGVRGHAHPISARLPAAERRAILELAAPSLVVGVDPSEVPDRPAVPPGFEPEAALADDPLPPAVPASWKALLSGGSTGRPKLIVAAQPGVLETVAFFYGTTPRVDEGVGLVTGPLAHNGPFANACGALLMGEHQVVMTRFDAARALDLIERYRVKEHPSVRGSCVIGLPDEDLGNVVHAIVQADDEVGDTELLAHLRVRLAPYKLPRSFERVTEPLRDEAGKVRRSALRALRVGAAPPGKGASSRLNRGQDGAG